MKRTVSRRLIAVLGTILGILLLLAGAGAAFRYKTCSLDSLYSTQAIWLTTACRAYALDEGAYPKDFEDLFPDYLEDNPPHSTWMGEDSPRWKLLVPGAPGAENGDPIALVESLFLYRKHRYVGYSDGTILRK